MLEETGERFIPNLGTQISYEHYSRYLFALDFVKGKRVLDCPCGEGYGSNLLATQAMFVQGIDISKPAIDHCQGKYVQKNLKYDLGSMADLSAFPDGSFDVVVCFEGIEHVPEDIQKLALMEFRRVLHEDGVLLMSTPNKRVYSDIPKFQNEFHIKEFYKGEFEDFLMSKFKNIEMFGQSIVNSNVLVNLNSKLHMSNVRFSPFASDDLPEVSLEKLSDIWMYFVAVCSTSKVSLQQRDGAMLVDFNRRLEKEVEAALTLKVNLMAMEIKSLRDRNDFLEASIVQLKGIISRTVEGAVFLLCRKIYRNIRKAFSNN